MIPLNVIVVKALWAFVFCSYTAICDTLRPSADILAKSDVDLPMFNPQGHRVLRRERLDLDIDDYQEFTKTRVEFDDGKIIAVEQLVD